MRWEAPLAIWRRIRPGAVEVVDGARERADRGAARGEKVGGGDRLRLVAWVMVGPASLEGMARIRAATGLARRRVRSPAGSRRGGRPAAAGGEAWLSPS